MDFLDQEIARMRAVNGQSSVSPMPTMAPATQPATPAGANPVQPSGPLPPLQPGATRPYLGEPRPDLYGGNGIAPTGDPVIDSLNRAAPPPPPKQFLFPEDEGYLKDREEWVNAQMARQYGGAVLRSPILADQARAWTQQNHPPQAGTFDAILHPFGKETPLTPEYAYGWVASQTDPVQIEKMKNKYRAVYPGARYVKLRDEQANKIADAYVASEMAKPVMGTPDERRAVRSYVMQQLGSRGWQTTGAGPMGNLPPVTISRYEQPPEVEWNSVVPQWLSEGVYAPAKGAVQGTAKVGFGLGELANSGVASAADAMGADGVAERARLGAQAYAPAREAMDRFMPATEMQKNHPYTLGLLETAGAVAPQVLVGWVTGPAAPLMMNAASIGGDVYHQSYQLAIQQGYSPQAANDLAFKTGAITAGATAVIDRFGPVQRILRSNPEASGILKRWAVGTAVGTATGGGMAAVQEAAPYLAGLKAEEKAALIQSLQNVGTAAIHGGALGGAMEAAHPILAQGQRSAQNSAEARAIAGELAARGHDPAEARAFAERQVYGDNTAPPPSDKPPAPPTDSAPQKPPAQESQPAPMQLSDALVPDQAMPTAQPKQVATATPETPPARPTSTGQEQVVSPQRQTTEAQPPTVRESAEVAPEYQDKSPTALPRVPAELAEGTNNQIRQWATDNGFDLNGLDKFGRKRLYAELQRQQAISELAAKPRLPAGAESWDAGRLRKWAASNGYEVPDAPVIDETAEPGLRPRDAVRQAIEAQYGASPENIAKVLARNKPVAPTATETPAPNVEAPPPAPERIAPPKNLKEAKARRATPPQSEPERPSPAPERTEPPPPVKPQPRPNSVETMPPAKAERPPEKPAQTSEPEIDPVDALFSADTSDKAVRDYVIEVMRHFTGKDNRVNGEQYRKAVLSGKFPPPPKTTPKPAPAVESAKIETPAPTEPKQVEPKLEDEASAPAPAETAPVNSNGKLKPAVEMSERATRALDVIRKAHPDAEPVQPKSQIQRAIAALQQAHGKEVVVLKSKDPFRGVVYDGEPDVLFIHEKNNSPEALREALAHELVDGSLTPEVRAKLKEAIGASEMQAAQDEYRKLYAKLHGEDAAAKLDPDRLSDEGLSLILGRDMTQPHRWRKLVDADPESHNALNDAIGKLNDKLGGVDGRIDNLLEGLRSAVPKVAPKPSAVAGSKTIIDTPTEKVPARYALIEADQVKPSNDPFTFQKNPDHAGGQERNYLRDTNERQKVIENAAKFDSRHVLSDDPTPANGPPMVIEDGSVMGGNSRAMVQQRVYRDAKRAPQLKADTIEAAKRFGLDPEVAARMDKPMIVRVLDENPVGNQGRLAELSRVLQKGLTQEMSTGQDAASRAKILAKDSDTLDRIAQLLSTDGESVRDVLSSPGKSEQLAHLLVESGAVNKTELSRYMKDSRLGGGFTEDGKKLVENILLSTAVQDPTALDGLPNNVIQKLTGNLADLAYVSTNGGRWSIGADLTKALEGLQRFRARGNGLTLDDWLNGREQMSLVPDPITEPGSERARRLLKALADDTAAEFKSRIRNYARDARAENPSQAKMFGAQDVSPAEAFDDAFGGDAPSLRYLPDSSGGYSDAQIAAALKDLKRGQKPARPDLSQRAETKEGRRAYAVADELRNAAKEPAPKPDKEVEAAADRLIALGDEGVDSLIERAKLGGQFSDAETLAARKIVDRDFDTALKAGDDAKITKLGQLILADRRAGTEQGRAFRQRRDPLTPAERVKRFVREALAVDDTAVEKPRGKDDKPGMMDEEKARQSAKKLREHLNKLGIDYTNYEKMTPDEAAALVREIQAKRSSRLDALYEYWINSILSGPHTSGFNSISNAANAGYQFALVRPLESLINRYVLRDAKGATPSELGKLYGGFLPGLQDAARHFLRSFKTETASFDIEHGMKGHGPFEARPVAISEHPTAFGFDLSKIGIRGSRVRTFTRALGAADQAAKALSGRMEVMARAHRLGLEKGLSGDKLSEFVTEQVKNPQSESWIGAWDFANSLTFNDSPGSFIQSVINARDKVPGARWVIPFVNTPANITKTAARYSPLNTPSTAYKLGRTAYEAATGKDFTYDRAKLAQHTAEQVLGWMAILAISSGVGGNNPWITGSKKPFSLKDRAEREEQFRAAPPMSIRIGDKWYSYARVEPFATTLGAVVNAIEEIQLARSGKQADKALGDFLTKNFGQLKDKTFLHGIGDLFDALEGGDKPVNYATNIATSFIPNLIRQPLSAADPMVREGRRLGEGDDQTGTLGDKIARKSLPGVVKVPQPKVDLWGEQVKKGPELSPATDIPLRVLGLQSQAASTSKLDRMILAWNTQHPNDPYHPQAPDPYLRVQGKDRIMDEREYNAYLRAAGRVSARRLESEKGLNIEQPTERDIKYMQKQIESVRDAARKTVQRAIVARDKGDTKTYEASIDYLNKLADQYAPKRP
jgi:hypothetical protein